jgi:hypothetical protein
MLGITITSSKFYTEYDKETGKIHKKEEVSVLEISLKSTVHGLIKVGDIVNSITVDGVTKEVTRRHHLIDSMLDARVGSSVIINVTRDGASVDVTVPIVQSMLTSCD